MPPALEHTAPERAEVHKLKPWSACHWTAGLVSLLVVEMDLLTEIVTAIIVFYGSILQGSLVTAKF